MSSLFLLPLSPHPPSPAQSASSTAPMGIVCVWARWSATSWITVGTTAMRKTALWSPSTLHRASSIVSASVCCSISVLPSLSLTPSNNTNRYRLASSTWFSIPLSLLSLSSLLIWFCSPCRSHWADVMTAPEVDHESCTISYTRQSSPGKGQLTLSQRGRLTTNCFCMLHCLIPLICQRWFGHLLSCCCCCWKDSWLWEQWLLTQVRFCDDVHFSHAYNVLHVMCILS